MQRARDTSHIPTFRTWRSKSSSNYSETLSAAQRSQRRVMPRVTAASQSRGANLSGLTRDSSTQTSSEWLSNPIQLQGELAMAIETSIEIMSQQLFAASPPAAAPAASPTPDQGSDSECDEVRSLSLSEEGPVMHASHRSHHGLQRDALAPDPIAMLSDGQLTAVGPPYTRAFSDYDNGTPVGDSDDSAATTRLEEASGRSPQHDVLDTLAPVFSKLKNQLAVVPEQAAGLASHRTHRQVRVPATKVKARRGDSVTMQALSLAQVSLSKEPEHPPRPLSARSDISIGSALSAFSSWSSPASPPYSHTTSPRVSAGRGRSLTMTSSMPTLSTKAGRGF